MNARIIDSLGFAPEDMPRRIVVTPLPDHEFFIVAWALNDECAAMLVDYPSGRAIYYDHDDRQWYEDGYPTPTPTDYADPALLDDITSAAAEVRKLITP